MAQVAEALCSAYLFPTGPTPKRQTDSLPDTDDMPACKRRLSTHSSSCASDSAKGAQEAAGVPSNEGEPDESDDDEDDDDEEEVLDLSELTPWAGPGAFDRTHRKTTLRAFRWVEVHKPESPHLRSMMAASRAQKGLFHDAELQAWLPIMLKPDFQTRLDPVYLYDGATRFCVPIYDPDQSIRWRLEVDSPPDNDLRGATAIFFAGQVRLGSARCSRCESRQIARETMDGTVRHPAPFPACVTAGRFSHGICASCYALGGTLAERLARCSVSRMLTLEEYALLGRDGGGGQVGPGVFIGEGAEEQLWLQQLLF